nr:glycosyltransferase family 39 protein [Terrimesophilobacter mesophilus]
MLQHVDAVHGTYYVLLHFWIDLFGASPLSVRFPSAVVAGLACSGAVVLAKMLFTRRVAVIAGVVCLLLPRFTYMGSEARSYALSAAVAVWLTILFVRLIAAQSAGIVWWASYAVGLALGIYVFLYVALIVVVHGVHLLVVDRQVQQWSRVWKRWLAATAAGLLLAAPVLALGIGERHQIAFLAHRTRVSFGLVVAGQWFGNVWLAALCWGLIALGCVAMMAAVRWHGVALMLAWCILPTAMLLSANAMLLPLYSNRYLSFCAPAAAILVAVGVAAIPRHWMRITALAALIALAIPGYVAERTVFGKPGHSDWAAVSAIIAQKAKPGDAIVFDNSVKPSWRPRLAMHVYPDDYRAVDDIALRTPYELRKGLWDAVYPLQDIAGRFAGVSRVWSLETTRTDMDSVDSDLHVLERDGFTVEHVYPVHRTIIYELVRSRS